MPARVSRSSTPISRSRKRSSITIGGAPGGNAPASTMNSPVWHDPRVGKEMTAGFQAARTSGARQSICRVRGTADPATIERDIGITVGDIDARMPRGMGSISRDVAHTSPWRTSSSRLGHRER